MTTLQTEPPLISIGMPVYNCAGTIAQAISSIVGQSFKDWELLVIDDGSTDRTLEIASSFDDPRIFVVRGGNNEHLPARLNQCVSKARGKYFARMDGDDIAYPHRLECQLDYLETHAEVDLVGGWVVVFRGDGTPIGTRRDSLVHEQICARPWRGFGMPHPTWMGKTDWFRRNRYSADSPRSQDQELLFRTHRASRFANVPEIVLGYREDGLSLSKILLARVDMGKMMLRSCRDRHTFTTGAMGMLCLVAKGLIDSIAIGTGLEYRLLRHRASGLRLDEASEFRSVFEHVGRAPDDCVLKVQGSC